MMRCEGSSEELPFVVRFLRSSEPPSDSVEDLLVNVIS